MTAHSTLPCPYCRQKFDVPYAKLTWPIVCPHCSKRSHFPLAARVLGMAATTLVVVIGLLVVKAFGWGLPETLPQLIALLTTVVLSGLIGGWLGLAVFRSQATYLVK